MKLVRLSSNSYALIVRSPAGETRIATVANVATGDWCIVFEAGHAFNVAELEYLSQQLKCLNREFP